MLEEKCDVWDKYDEGEWICILTNGNVDHQDHAIMGAGIAKEAKLRFPELPKKLGALIGVSNINDTYILDNYRMVIFPTKYNYFDRSDIELIVTGCKMLIKYLDHVDIPRIYLPRPGCGNGGLEWDYVKSYIEPLLDDRVIVVWR